MPPSSRLWIYSCTGTVRPPVVSAGGLATGPGHSYVTHDQTAGFILLFLTFTSLKSYRGNGAWISTYSCSSSPVCGCSKEAPHLLYRHENGFNLLIYFWGRNKCLDFLRYSTCSQNLVALRSQDADRHQLNIPHLAVDLSLIYIKTVLSLEN